MHLSLSLPIAAALLTTTTMASPLNARTMTMAWSVRNFTRNCTDPDICTYHLTIDTGGSMMQNCTTVDANPVNPMTNMPVLATTHAWYDVPCKENPNYHLSWGWDYTADFTVMTVKDVMTNMDAFFGYNHPNAGLPICVYPDVGPNAVQMG